MNIELSKLFTNLLEPISYLIFTISFLLYYQKEKTVKIKVLWFYNLLALAMMISISVDTFWGQNNIDTYNLFFITTVLCFSVYFWLLFRSKTKKTIVVLFAVLCSVYFLVRIFFPPPVKMFDSIAFSLLSIMIVLMAFFYFQQILTKVTEESLFVQIDFWFIISLLIRYSGNFVIYLTYYYLTKKILANHYTRHDRYLLTQLWGGHNILLFLSSVVFNAGTLWTIYRRKF